MAQLAAIELHPSLSLAPRPPTNPACSPSTSIPARPPMSSTAARWRCGCVSSSTTSACSLSPDLGLEGPAGLRAAQQRRGHLRGGRRGRRGGRSAGPSDRPAAREADAERGRLENEKGRAKRQGLRRLVTEPPSQDDDRGLLAARPRTPHRLDPGPPGKRSSTRPAKRTPTRSSSMQKDVPEANRASTATSSSRC